MAISASFTFLDDGGRLVCERERPSSKCCLATTCLDEGDLQTNKSLFCLFFFSSGKKKKKTEKE